MKKQKIVSPTPFSNSLIILFSWMFFGCILLGSCEGEEIAEEKTASNSTYSGEYLITDFNVRVSSSLGDTNYILDRKPSIVFETDNSLSVNKLKVKLEEFVEDLFEEALSITSSDITASADFNNIAVVTLSESNFKISDFQFEVILTEPGMPAYVVSCTLQMDGNFVGNGLKLDYGLNFFRFSTITFRFSGSVTGEK